MGKGIRKHAGNEGGERRREGESEKERTSI